jgi:hypothetical protein
MYKPLRAALKSLLREFRRASTVYPPLFHEQIFSWEPTTLPKKTWDAFINAAQVRKKSGWETFHVFPNLKCCGRFFGNEAGLEEAIRLGESLFLVICELDPALDREEGYFGFLNVLDDMAFKYPTALLRVRFGVWEKVFEPSPEISEEKHELDYADWFEEQVARWTTPENGGESYPSNPYCRTLVQNVFTSAMGAIQNILNPENALLIGDKYDDLPFAAAKEDQTVVDTSHAATDKLIHELTSTEDEPQDKSIPVQESPASQTSTKSVYQFHQRKSGTWDVRFVGEEDELPNWVGFEYIAHLLANPENRIEAIVLAGGEDSSVANVTMKPDFAFDKKYRQDIAKQLADLEQTMSQAESGDPSLLMELKEEYEKLRAINEGDDKRRLGAPPAKEQARKAVAIAIERAIKKIAKKMPECAKFLGQSIKPAGTARIYSPVAPAPKWVLK